MKTVTLTILLAAVMLAGCTTTAIRERWDRQVDRWTRTPDNPGEPSKPGEWRRDMATLQASNNAVRFRTRNLSIPGGNGENRDTGMEWIITRVHGSGYQRMLIMVMGGARPPTRIYFQHSDGRAEEINSRWSMPMMQEAQWEVRARDGKIAILIDGREIWSKSGGYTVTHAAMNGYPNRFSTGEWAE